MRNLLPFPAVTFLLIWKYLLLWLGCASPADSITSCKIHQFRCDSGKCIDLDQYCNGRTDCPDSSDEPRHCTPCNRTYYGMKSSTYNLQLHNPQASKQTFSCSITFIAASGLHGDLIQLKFNSIFLSKKSAQEETTNCETTKLIIQEPDRQIYSEFCPYSFSNKLYFSETNRLILTFITSDLSSHLNFDFKMSFKFIGKDEAVVRYGKNNFRGELLPGTPCSLLFNNCYRQRCSLQSPNYPGLYPRNVTCYYAIRHHNAPDTVNYHSVINLQTLSLNIQSKVQNNLTFSNSRDFKEHCVDTLTVYDGYTIRDPVLVSVCGRGMLENITSSSNELLVEFHSTGVNLLPDEPANGLAVQGFHMLATIHHIRLNSNKYVENHNCVFRISSLHEKSGYVESPNHSLPSKTHCVYQIQGNSHELIWLQIMYYDIQSDDCNNTFLAVYDGPYDLIYEDRNSPLVRVCNNQTETLRSCEYKLNRNASRPCLPTESYISSSNQMTIQARTEAGTIMDELSFRIYYEFIDIKQDGVEMGKPCGRIITQTGPFHSPRNTFLYGRGGRKHVRCFYQFLPGTILLDFFLMPSSTCSTVFNENTHRYECSVDTSTRTFGKRSPPLAMTGQVKYYKLFNNETRIEHGCFCSNVNQTIRFSSKFAQQIEIVVQNMEHWADSSHFQFNGSYVQRTAVDHEELTEVRTYTSLSGLIHLTNGTVVIVQPPSSYYYAYVFNSDSTKMVDCRSSMLLVHSVHKSSGKALHNSNADCNNDCNGSASHLANASSITKVCPNQVNLYSPNYNKIRDSENKLVLELVSETGVKLNYVMIQKQSESVCEFYCASIDGCLPTQVLCNGLNDCPDSSDEVGCQFNYNYEYLVAIFIIIVIILISLYIYHNCTRRPFKETAVS